jgi:hypothetical protein
LINVTFVMEGPLTFFKFFVKVRAFCLEEFFCPVTKLVLRWINWSFKYNFRDLFNDFLIKIKLISIYVCKSINALQIHLIMYIFITFIQSESILSLLLLLSRAFSIFEIRVSSCFWFAIMVSSFENIWESFFRSFSIAFLWTLQW